MHKICPGHISVTLLISAVHIGIALTFFKSKRKRWSGTDQTPGCLSQLRATAGSPVDSIEKLTGSV